MLGTSCVQVRTCLAQGRAWGVAWGGAYGTGAKNEDLSRGVYGALVYIRRPFLGRLRGSSLSVSLDVGGSVLLHRVALIMNEEIHKYGDAKTCGGQPGPEVQGAWQVRSA